MVKETRAHPVLSFHSETFALYFSVHAYHWITLPCLNLLVWISLSSNWKGSIKTSRRAGKERIGQVHYFILWGPASKLLVHIIIVALKYRLDYICVFACLSRYLHVLFIFAGTTLIIMPCALVSTPKTLLNWTEEGILKNSEGWTQLEGGWDKFTERI